MNRLIHRAISEVIRQMKTNKFLIPYIIVNASNLIQFLLETTAPHPSPFALFLPKKKILSV